MRRILFLVALGGALGPAWTFGQEQAPEQWLASAANIVEPGVVEPETALDLGLPEVRYAGPCSVSLNCGDGNTVMCTGNSSCYANQIGYVECDGNRTYCPNFCQVFLYCSDCPRCSGTFCASCTSSSGNCQQGPGWIKCNGWTVTCSKVCR